MIKHPAPLLLAALIVAWSFDFLFWGARPGISFALFVSICLGAGLMLSGWLSMRPATSSYGLLLPIGFFAVMSFVRKEPFTQFVNYTTTLFLIALLARTFLGGRWLRYSFSDFIVGYSLLLMHSLSAPPGLLSQAIEKHLSPADQPGLWRRPLPFLRGVFIALPIVALFSALLSSADPIFSQLLADVLDLLAIEKLKEYGFRTVYILIFAYLLAGGYLFALSQSDDRRLLGLDRPWLPRFVGATEAAIVLGAVNFLFASFVIVQFVYFFGGQANISVNGYTYAEYARRGFWELLVVAMFSFGLHFGLSQITDREGRRQRRLFSALGSLLVLLVLIILVSAFQRLLLYESAFGFTRLRTYAHVFMVWLGLLLVGVLVLEIGQHQRSFAGAALMASLGFGISLNVLNVDAFIVHQNVSRAQSGRPLDRDYLLSLSVDAVPAMAIRNNLTAVTDTPGQELDEDLTLLLVCHALLHDLYEPEGNWRSAHLAQYRARKIWQTRSAATKAAAATAELDNQGRMIVTIDAERQPCRSEPRRW